MLGCPGCSVAGPGDPIQRPASYKGKIAYEGELGIVIGRHCKDVPESEAADYIFGYTCVNDVTAAELLNEDVNFPQWCRAKGYDSFGCLGPVIVPDLDWTQARVITRLDLEAPHPVGVTDGVERQNYPLSDMVFSPAEQVSRISHDMSLLPGDVIACGTSLGVGSIKDGSIVEITIDGVGSLVNALAPTPGVLAFNVAAVSRPSRRRECDQDRRSRPRQRARSSSGVHRR